MNIFWVSLCFFSGGWKLRLQVERVDKASGGTEKNPVHFFSGLFKKATNTGVPRKITEAERVLYLFLILDILKGSFQTLL